MPWVKFTKNYDFMPARYIMIPFKKGQVKFVTRDCAEKAKEKHCAIDAERPVKKDAAERS